MAESSSGSVTLWLGELRAGQADAARKLWERYFQSLVRIAASHLRGAPRGVADEEDVALSVFDSLCRRTAGGQLPPLSDRHDLWRLLVVISRQKSIDHRRTQGRQKRGGGLVLTAAAQAGEDSADALGLDEFLGAGPQPDEIAAMREDLNLLLQSLPDEALRTVALGKLEGQTNDELAGLLQVNPRTIERKLQLIRGLWLQRLASLAES